MPVALRQDWGFVQRDALTAMLPGLVDHLWQSAGSAAPSRCSHSSPATTSRLYGCGCGASPRSNSCFRLPCWSRSARGWDFRSHIPTTRRLPHCSKRLARFRNSFHRRTRTNGTAGGCCWPRSRSRCSPSPAPGGYNSSCATSRSARGGSAPARARHRRRRATSGIPQIRVADRLRDVVCGAAAAGGRARRSSEALRTADQQRAVAARRGRDHDAGRVRNGDAASRRRGSRRRAHPQCDHPGARRHRLWRHSLLRARRSLLRGRRTGLAHRAAIRRARDAAACSSPTSSIRSRCVRGSLACWPSATASRSTWTANVSRLVESTACPCRRRPFDRPSSEETASSLAWHEKISPGPRLSEHADRNHRSPVAIDRLRRDHLRRDISHASELGRFAALVVAHRCSEVAAALRPALRAGRMLGFPVRRGQFRRQPRSRHWCRRGS